MVIARNGLQRITLEVTVIEAENLGPLIVKQKSVAGIEEILLFYEEVSTREFQDHLQRLNGIEVSPTVISNVTNKIMPLIKEWQNRPLPNIYAVVFMDAIHFNVRQDGQITKKAAYMSVGIDLEGRKDVLGIGSANMNPLSSD